ncbi:hypothetical protein HBI68_254470 [Parastagonospora nodorum]|nr:hypothetical protein HBI84_249180 [Parastagonospora nodorum]KAH6132837.1 hypothetical protein HBI68_254470 [Parastagonospora nodorum]KAH6383353.1 hypothetical protein HBI60_257270 [Parastagonospora nodorum]KAH6515610.1 hypothetical protein HBI07_251040 [Parastagonospora nodorum]
MSSLRGFFAWTVRLGDHYEQNDRIDAAPSPRRAAFRTNMHWLTPEMILLVIQFLSAALHYVVSLQGHSRKRSNPRAARVTFQPFGIRKNALTFRPSRLHS